jgi:hypothetical protein
MEKLIYILFSGISEFFGIFLPHHPWAVVGLIAILVVLAFLYLASAVIHIMQFVVSIKNNKQKKEA